MEGMVGEILIFCTDNGTAATDAQRSRGDTTQDDLALSIETAESASLDSHHEDWIHIISWELNDVYVDDLFEGQDLHR